MDGMLSWSGWVTYIRQFTHKVVTVNRCRAGKVCQPKIDVLTTEPSCQLYRAFEKYAAFLKS